MNSNKTSKQPLADGLGNPCAPRIESDFGTVTDKPFPQPGETFSVVPARCPTCDSPKPELHPAVQVEGEVSICRNDFHRIITPENTPERIFERLGSAVEPKQDYQRNEDFGEFGDATTPGFFKSAEKLAAESTTAESAKQPHPFQDIPELLPCPFCGFSDIELQGQKVVCLTPDCFADGQGNGEYASAAAAITAWNRRAAIKQAEETTVDEPTQLRYPAEQVERSFEFGMTLMMLKSQERQRKIATQAASEPPIHTRVTADMDAEHRPDCLGCKWEARLSGAEAEDAKPEFPSLCPFCKSDDVSPVRDGTRKTPWAVLCSGCLAEGPSTDTKQRAIELWDRRAAQPPIADIPDTTDVVEWLKNVYALGTSERSVVPSQNAGEMLVRLDELGFGKQEPRRGNTLYAMVMDAADEIERLRTQSSPIAVDEGEALNELLHCASEIGRSDICAGVNRAKGMTPHSADCPAWYRQRIEKYYRRAPSLEPSSLSAERCCEVLNQVGHQGRFDWHLWGSDYPQRIISPGIPNIPDHRTPLQSIPGKPAYWLEIENAQTIAAWYLSHGAKGGSR